MIPKDTTIKQTPRFSQQKKKLHKKDLTILNEAVEKIAMEPKIGELKRGDLLDVRVYKFQVKNQRQLVAYQYEVTKGITRITLLAYGSHENFYSDLKNYQKSKK